MAIESNHFREFLIKIKVLMMSGTKTKNYIFMIKVYTSKVLYIRHSCDVMLRCVPSSTLPLPIVHDCVTTMGTHVTYLFFKF